MNWAWAQALPPSSKLVLMALADAADEVGLCWPRVRIIAKKCCVSERTVQRVIKQFEHDNVLMVETDWRKNGAQTSNRYHLQMAPRPAPDKLSPGVAALPSTRSDNLSPPPGHPRRWEGDTVLSPQELPTKPSIETTTTCASPDEPLAGASLVMPRRLAEGDRAGVMALLRDVPALDAQILLDELASALELTGTIKTTPGRWFYGLVKKYGQGAFNPVGAPRVAELRAKPKAPLKMERVVPASPEVSKAHIAKIAATLHIAAMGAK